MSWANEICSSDAEERAIVLGLMNAFGYAFHAWLPLLTYPQAENPRFKKGRIFSIFAFLAQFGITGLVDWLRKREVGERERGVEVGGGGVDELARLLPE